MFYRKPVEKMMHVLVSWIDHISNQFPVATYSLPFVYFLSLKKRNFYLLETLVSISVILFYYWKGNLDVPIIKIESTIRGFLSVAVFQLIVQLPVLSVSLYILFSLYLLVCSEEFLSLVAVHFLVVHVHYIVTPHYNLLFIFVLLQV